MAVSSVATRRRSPKTHPSPRPPRTLHNRYNREAVTKVFKSGNTELIQGSIDDTRFGTLMRVDGIDRQFDGLYREGRFASIRYDENGVPVSLYGMAPDDGRMGFWQAKPGENVITLLGG